MRRRRSNAHMVMAEATTEGSKKLVSALREITTTNKEMEMRKLDL
jgi:hypothetical protein